MTRFYATVESSVMSLEDTPKNQAKGEKRSAPSPPLEKTSKRGKGGSSPSYAEVATSQPPNKEGDWHVVMKKIKKKKKEKKEKRAEDPAQKAQGTTATPKSKRSTPARSGDAIKVSAKDGQCLEGNEGESRPPEGRT